MAKKTEETETDLTAYLTKEATDLQSRFADWILDEDIVGYDPSKAKTKEEAFREGVRLATAMRMIFQASPENKAANAERKAARAEEAEEEEAPAPKSKKAAAKPAPAKKASKKAAAPVEEEEEPEETPAPKKTKKAAVKKRKPASDDDEAPF